MKAMTRDEMGFGDNPRHYFGDVLGSRRSGRLIGRFCDLNLIYCFNDKNRTGSY